MKIILSPAKKMMRADDDFTYESLPVFLKETEALLSELRSFDYGQLKKVWNCSDAIVKTNMERLETMNLYEKLSPAIFSYVGLAFQHLAPGAMTVSQLEYIRTHLRILSGFYGVLKPFDGVTPYRLEMQAVLPVSGSLYDFWNRKIYDEVMDEERLIINLASKEYSRCVESYLSKSDHMITVVFAEMKNDRPVQKGTMAKMARGEMVYWMAENRITEPEQLRSFDTGYAYSSLLSDEKEYVFLKK